MLTIGLIGGMSWESSAEYYRLLNQGVRDRLGPSASARCLLWSFDLAEIERLQHAGEWEALAKLMADAACRLAGAGAELLLLCTNTMHRVAPAIEAACPVPLLHIADQAAERAKAAGLRRVGLLGTAFTMEQAFYRDRLVERHGLEVLVPDAAGRAAVHRIIYEELVAGRIEAASRRLYREIIGRLVTLGAEAIVLGCTEIGLLVQAEDSPVPLLDTTALHVAAALELALAG